MCINVQQVNNSDIDAESKDVATEEDASVTAKSVPTMKGRAQTATCRSTRKSLTSGKPVRPHTAKVIRYY